MGIRSARVQVESWLRALAAPMASPAGPGRRLVAPEGERPVAPSRAGGPDVTAAPAAVPGGAPGEAMAPPEVTGLKEVTGFQEVTGFKVATGPPEVMAPAEAAAFAEVKAPPPVTGLAEAVGPAEAAALVEVTAPAEMAAPVAPAIGPGHTGSEDPDGQETVAAAAQWASLPAVPLGRIPAPAATVLREPPGEWPRRPEVVADVVGAALAPLLPSGSGGTGPPPAATVAAGALAVSGTDPPDASHHPAAIATSSAAPDPTAVGDLADLLAGVLEDEARALGVLELEP